MAEKFGKLRVEREVCVAEVEEAAEEEISVPGRIVDFLKVGIRRRQHSMSRKNWVCSQSQLP